MGEGRAGRGAEGLLTVKQQSSEPKIIVIITAEEEELIGGLIISLVVFLRHRGRYKHTCPHVQTAAGKASD